MLIKHITQIPTSEVQTFLCADVNEAISQLDISPWSGPASIELVTQTWENLPSHEYLLDDILRSLAQVTLAVWPSWYGGKITFASTGNATLEDDLLNHFKLQELKATRQDVCIPWVKSAVDHCQSGKLPILLEGFSKALQASQLALVIDPYDLIVVLATQDRHPQEYRLLSLARAATWIAKETKSRVAVLIPEELLTRRELDSILYKAISLPSTTQKAGNSTDDESKHTIWPVQGRPHPFSPGEQFLSKKLLLDEELAELFFFNQRIKTVRGREYLVDLLWSKGRIVVEVDGYKHHRNHFAFVEDRNRDYELLISGYRVLRLPHDEVVNDVEIAIEKIRDVVRFCRNQQITRSEVLQ